MTIQHTTDYQAKYFSEKKFLEDLQRQKQDFLGNPNLSGSANLDTKLQEIQKNILLIIKLSNASLAASEQENPQHANIDIFSDKIQNLFNEIRLDTRNLAILNLEKEIDKSRRSLTSLVYILNMQWSLEKKTLELESLKCNRRFDLQQIEDLKGRIINSGSQKSQCKKPPRFESEVQNLKSEIQNLESKVQSLKNKAQELGSEVEKLKSENSEYKEKICQIEEDFNKAQQSLQTTKSRQKTCLIASLLISTITFVIMKTLKKNTLS